MNLTPPAPIVVQPQPASLRERAMTLLSRGAWLVALAAPLATWLVVLKMFEPASAGFGFKSSPHPVIEELSINYFLTGTAVIGTLGAAFIVAVLLYRRSNSSWGLTLVTLTSAIPWAAGIATSWMEASAIGEGITHATDKAGIAAAGFYDAEWTIKLGAALVAVTSGALALALSLRAPQGERRSKVWLLLAVLPVVVAGTALARVDGAVTLPLTFTAVALSAGICLSVGHSGSLSPASLVIGGFGLVAAMVVLHADVTQSWWTVRSTPWAEDIPWLTEQWSASARAFQSVLPVAAAAALGLFGGALGLSARAGHRSSPLLHLALTVIVGLALVYLGHRFHGRQAEFYESVRTATGAAAR